MHDAAPTPTCCAIRCRRRGRTSVDVAALSQGRVDAHHRQPQAPVGPVAVPVRAVQRLDRRGHHGHRGVLGLHGGVRGVFRGAARAAVHRGDAVVDQRRRRSPSSNHRAGVAISSRSHPRCTPRPSGWPSETGGHYLDQFTNAERATDWRGNNNIAESIFEQMGQEPHPIPDWIVVGAGTGGTSATIGRYIRYRRHATRLCVVDPGELGVLPVLRPARPGDVDDGRRPRASRASAGRGSNPRSCPASSTG